MKIPLLFVLLLLVCGCSVNPRLYVPKDAFNSGVQTVSVPHPYEQEKRGVKAVTSFEVIIDPGLLIGGGFGMYPAMAEKPDGVISKGYVLVVPDVDGLLPMTRTCDVLGRVFFELSKEELKDVKVLVFSNDMGWSYTLRGQELPIAEDKKQPLLIYYDPKRYDDDVEYRKKLFATWGTTLYENQQIWKNYYDNLKITYEDNVFEVVVGSSDWADYKEEILKNLPRVYQMPLGEYRIGFLPPDDFRKKATELSDSNSSLRFFKRVGLPISLIGASFTVAGAIAPAASLAGDLATAFIDDEQRHTYSARSFVMRHDLAQIPRLISASCKNKMMQKLD
ncbi:hypothetical protein HGA64_01695 [Candidatus Falkowbacteria bacterium]|nr:hypothetical protein [Candidatus Falkowbacteria bacterium]